jgi:hypothetical protein
MEWHDSNGEVIFQMFGIGASASRDRIQRIKILTLQLLVGDKGKDCTSIAELLSNLPRALGVTGIGFGLTQDQSGRISGPLSIRIYVGDNDTTELRKLIPSLIEGVPTTFVQVGTLKALGSSCLHVQGGAGIRLPNVATGTLGCLMSRRFFSNQRFALSNNHVLADVNTARCGQPIEAFDDESTSWKTIGELSDIALLSDKSVNYIDAALVKLERNSAVGPEILSIGRVRNPPTPPTPFQSVRKHGHRTGHTAGVVVDISAAFVVPYKGGFEAPFDQQIGILGVNGQFSDNEDSGSLVVDAVSLKPLGLLFASNPPVTFSNPIGLVCNHFRMGVV